MHGIIAAILSLVWFYLFLITFRNIVFDPDFCNRDALGRFMTLLTLVFSICMTVFLVRIFIFSTVYNFAQ